MAGVVAALAVSVTATGYTTAGADDQVKLSREEKLIANGKTKVTKYFNSKGQLVAEAATKPEDTVTLVQAGDGAVELAIKPGYAAFLIGG